MSEQLQQLHLERVRGLEIEVEEERVRRVLAESELSEEKNISQRTRQNFEPRARNLRATNP